MSVSAAQSPLLQTQLAPQQHRQTAAIFDASASVPAAQKDAAPSPAAPETGTVSLQGQPPAAQQAPAKSRAPEVFAEIWKDGTKIGNVYTDGTAVMPTMDAGIAAGSYFSAPIPYARAQEISRMVGGEMRVVDLKALQVAQTRHQLRSAYGA